MRFDGVMGGLRCRHKIVETQLVSKHQYDDVVRGRCFERLL